MSLENQTRPSALGMSLKCFHVFIEKGRFVTYLIAGGAISFQSACSNIQSASFGSQERQKG